MKLFANYNYILIILTYKLLVNAEFTLHFCNFLRKEYGNDYANKFIRPELGLDASFGGKTSDNDIVENNPIVFVHGLGGSAFYYNLHYLYFTARDYKGAELYGTTYSDVGRTPITDKTMDCIDVKQIRDFILIVAKYTNSTKVNVVGFSMGVAITRKAILGGYCVDTNENIGEPLTNMIDVYVGVAGVAYGFQFCPHIFKMCNKVNGMTCDSEYMQDVNNPIAAYEGTHRFALYSQDDWLVGQSCCGHQCSTIKNANATIAKCGYDHVTIFLTTKDIQYSLLYNKTVPS